MHPRREMSDQTFGTIFGRSSSRPSSFESPRSPGPKLSLFSNGISTVPCCSPPQAKILKKLLDAVAEGIRVNEESSERYLVIRGYLCRLFLQPFLWAVYYRFSIYGWRGGCNSRAPTSGRLIRPYHEVDCNHPVVEIASRLVIKSLIVECD